MIRNTEYSCLHPIGSRFVRGRSWGRRDGPAFAGGGGRASDGSDDPRDADPARGVGAVPGLLLLEVERADAGTGGERGIVEQVCRDQPDHLELEAVGVLAVEALGGAVVG